MFSGWHVFMVFMQMLMVIFDILASHQRMSKWHEKGIQASLREQQTMHTARLDLQQRINSNAQASTSHAEPETAASHHAEHPGQNAASVPASGNVRISGAASDLPVQRCCSAFSSQLTFSLIESAQQTVRVIMNC